jgi:quinol---cytochrome c reductase iron-sulfur subunit, bacillus type
LVPVTTTRRSFYSTLINLLGAIIAAVIAIPAGVYLLFKPKSSADEAMVEVADLADLEVDIPQEVVYYRTRVDGWKTTKEKTTTWVVKTGDNAAVAFSPQCPHLGCIYHWQDDLNAFQCPCHASAFATDGKVLAGPAPRPLDRYDSKVEGGRLLIGNQIHRS